MVLLLVGQKNKVLTYSVIKLTTASTLLSQEIEARRRKTHTVIKQNQVSLRGAKVVLCVLVRGTHRHRVERRQGGTWARNHGATREGTKIRGDTGTL